MASQGSRPDRVPGGGQDGGCPQLRPGCAGWYQEWGCCVAAYAAGWVLLGRGATAAAERRPPDGGCPRFLDPSAQALGAIVARTSRRVTPPSWLSSGGRSV
jgi:hypothetical protein